MPAQQYMRRLVDRVAPINTRRRQYLKLPLRALRSVRKRGLWATLQLAQFKVGRKLLRTPRDRERRWFHENEPTWHDLRAQRDYAWPVERPTITLLLRAANTTESMLRQSLRSLDQQTYPHWEVCLLALPAEADLARRVARQVLGSDTRFRLCISTEASELNAAIAEACGTFLGIVNAGDTLAPNALFEMACHLLATPDCDVAYSDEDGVSPTSGKRHGLQLKPGWSPDLMLSHNYVGGLTLMRRSLLDTVGGFDGTRGEALEWDALLRISEHTQNFSRVAKCLYHRRCTPGSRPSTPPQATEVLRDHLRRRGLNATVDLADNGACRASWPIDNPPLVSIIIPSVNNLPIVRQCVSDLLGKTSYANKEIIIVDNDSDDPAVHRYYAECCRTGRVKVVPYSKEFNYSEACNTGYRAARGEILLFLNNDISVKNSDWLDEMVRWCLLPGVGCVGTKLLYPNGKIQHAGVVIGMHLCGLIWTKVDEGHRDVFGSPETYRNYLAIMGACQMMPRKVFEEVGGFDETYRIANSDVAICLRAWQAGYRTVYTPYAALYHHEGYTRGKTNPIEDIQRTVCDLREMAIEEDPFFHPALSPHESTPTLRLHPDPSPAEFLRQQLDELLPQQERDTLDVCDDAAIRRHCGELADRVPALRWNLITATECPWAAASLALLLIRTSPYLRERFPYALSEGVDGAYCQWLCDEFVTMFGLPLSTQDQFREAFRMAPSARARQIYELRQDLRQVMPLALLPSGRKQFFAWLIGNGKPEHQLRDEEIWWLVLECAENPTRELAYTYLITPEWQSYFPEAMTETGWRVFLAWVKQRFGLHGDGLDNHPFVSPLNALEQLRLAYNNRPRWRRQLPEAFANPPAIAQLASWPDAPEDRSGNLLRFRPSHSATTPERSEHFHLGMNVLGHFCYPSGLQVSVRSIVDSLRMMDIPVQCRDVPVGLDSDVPGHGHYLGLDLHDYTLIHVQPEPFFDECYPRSGLHPRARSDYRMAMWYWEFGEIPPEWRDQAETLQEIWAPTQFIADAFRRSLSLPVTPMLPGVRLGAVKNVSREDLGIPEDRTVFLFIFDMRSIMERKNPLDLIKAYQAAFKYDDRASLVIKVSRGKDNPHEYAKLRSAAKEAGAILIDRTLPREEVNGLIQACDCYVSLHRSEGLGLTMAESMLLGKPVIATNYSGNTDFMSVADSLLVDYRLVPLAHDIPPYKKGLLWAQPSCEQAAHWMRWVYSHPDEAKDLGERGRVAAEQVLSMEASGERLLRRLTEIHAARHGQPKVVARAA